MEQATIRLAFSDFSIVSWLYVSFLSIIFLRSVVK